jgi:hypothetical protein
MKCLFQAMTLSSHIFVLGGGHVFVLGGGHIFVLVVSILSLSMIFLLDFGNIPTV